MTSQHRDEDKKGCDGVTEDPVLAECDKKRGHKGRCKKTTPYYTLLWNDYARSDRK